MKYVIMSVEAAREIHRLAGQWLRLWDHQCDIRLMALPNGDVKELPRMVGTPDQEASKLRHVHNAMSACVDAILEPWMPSDHGLSAWTYISKIQCGSTDQTAAVRLLCRAAYDAYLNETGRLEPELSPREAWGDLKAAWDAARAPLATEAPKPIESEAPPHPSLATEAADETPPARPASEPEALTPPARAVAAAYDLQREGKPISVRAACERAKVDRANLRKRHPEAVALIVKVARPDQAARRGIRNHRTGDVDGVDDFDGRD